MINYVTGASGLLGARLIYDLAKKGDKIIVLKRKETPKEKLGYFLSFYSKNVASIINDIQWVEGNITDFEVLLNSIPEKSNVYHCAAMVSFNPADKDKIFESNVEGTENMVSACLINNVNKLCFVSSIAAIGKKINGQEITEDTPWSTNGKSDYSLSKYYAEMEVWKGIAEGLNAVIVNPATILGPGDWNSGSAEIFKTIAKGLRFYTKGSTGYVDVRDVSDAMIKLTESDISDNRFILASATLTYQELFNKIAKALKVKSPNIYANKFLTGLAFRVLNLVSLFTRKPGKLNKQTHKVIHSLNLYNGTKIFEHLNFKYISIDNTIKYVSEKYLAMNH